MMSSVDGRLLADRWTEPFDGKDKTEFYGRYEEAGKLFKAGAWMIGRTTAQQDFETGSFDFEKYVPAKEFETHIGNRASATSAIILDPKGKLSYTGDNLNGDNIIAVLGETVSEEYLTHLRNNGISYLFAGKDGNDLHKALEILHSDFGQKTILLEGGGVVSGAFLKEGLIDELSVIVYPGIDGLAGMPAIIDYRGQDDEYPAQNQSIEFLSAEILNDGMVWLRYKFHSQKKINEIKQYFDVSCYRQ